MILAGVLQVVGTVVVCDFNSTFICKMLTYTDNAVFRY
jgi:hypothetical protein